MAVAITALAFTIGSFWWLNARRGSLRLVGRPRSFALSSSGNRLALNVPLSLHNTGPTSVWLINAHLSFAEDDMPLSLPFVATRPGVLPTSDDSRPWATQLVLAGRESRVICCEFVADMKAPLQLVAGDKHATLTIVEHRSWGRERTRALGPIVLHITDQVIATQHSYIAHDNFA